MKSTAEKSSTTTSATATRLADRPFFGKAGRGGFFSPAMPAVAPAVQMKMAVNKPGDGFEQEADRMAGKVLRMPAPAPIKEEKLQRQSDDKLQKKEEEKIQKAAIPEEKVQKAAMPEEKVQKNSKEEKIQKAPALEEKLQQQADDKPQKKEEEKIQKAPERKEKLQRNSGAGSPAVGAATQSAIQNKTTCGQPLSTDVRSYMEPRFNADFSNVRIHSDPASTSLSNQLSARAFTYQNHVFFSRDQYQPGTSEGKHLLAHELTHTIQQGAAVQRSPQVSTTVTQPHIQRSVLGEIREWFAGKADNIPGFRMFTVVLGLNPITMTSVDRSAANILRALIEVMPGGAFITQALDNHGVFNKVGDWVEGQIKSLGMVGEMFQNALTEFLDSLGASDMAPWNWGDVWNRAERIFTAPIDRLISFAIGLVTDILKFVKDAVLKPLAAMAQGTRGYDLLKAVLGEDPITGEQVAPSADNLIGGFMKLIGQEEVWENIKKGKAVARAWAWFQNALSGLMSLVRAIPRRIIDTITSLTFLDIITVAGAFGKIVGAFAGIAGDFISWGLDAVWNLLEIIFDVVKPGLMGYIKKTGAALKGILKNPLPFVGNLVRAAKLGFTNFASRFGAHLKAGLIDWLTGSLSGVYIPKALSLMELGKFALSVLGITWAQIRGKIVMALGPNGETIMKGLETGFDIVMKLITGGPAAAWELIKDKLTDLKDAVVSGIIGFVTDTIVKKAIPKLISMFIPGAGFISAIISIYDTIMVFVQKISKIIQVVTAFIDSIVSIAAGNIGSAAKRVESVLGGLLSLAISFLAGFLGLGKVTDKIMEVIGKVRGTVDKAIDAVIAWIVGKAKALFGKLFGGKEETAEEKQKRLEAGAAAAVAAVAKYAGKRVGALLLKPLLFATKIRYRLSVLEPIRQGDEWFIRAEINPVTTKKTGVKAGSLTAEVKIDYEPHWPLDEFLSKANAIKRAAEKKPVSEAKTLPIDPTTKKQESTKGRRIGGQAAFRNEIHAFIDKIPEKADKDSAKALMSKLQADHQQELQMSGTDDPSNLAMIESRMNSQLGAMFRGQLKDLEPETVIDKVIIEQGAAIKGQHKESGTASALQNILLQYAKVLNTPTAIIKNWFKLD